MDDLVRKLRQTAVERRPEVCLGCGREQGCSLHGCAVIQEAADKLEAVQSLDFAHMDHPVWVPARAIMYFQSLLDATLEGSHDKH